MKKLSLIILCVSLLTSENGFSQFQEKLTNTQFNKLLTVFKGRRSDFGSYYFNNFPCTQCSNGFFYIKEGNSLESSYSYKGISFKGILKSPQLNYEEKADKLYLTCSWFNTGNTGGYKSANISFEFSFESENTDWNTLLRFQSGNSEMVAYYTLTRKQLDDVFNILVNETKFKDIITNREKKENEIGKLDDKVNSTFNSIIDFYKQIPALNKNEEFKHRDLTYIHPVGWDTNEKYFAYFTDFGSGAQYFDFRIDQLDNNGKTKNVSIIKCEIDCNIDEFLVSQNDILRKEIYKYGINKIEDTILKNNIKLTKDKGLKLVITKSLKGTCYDMLAEKYFTKIKSLDINLKDNSNKVVSNYSLDLSNGCEFDFQNIGYIESPSKKVLLFLIEHWGVNGYEGYPAVDIDLVSFNLK
jgi:hypothetical protein